MPRFLLLLLLALSLAFGVAPEAGAKPKDGPLWHRVYSGQTLGRIAKRYNVTVDAICAANGINKRAPIKPGQRLVIPSRKDKTGAQARHWRAAQELRKKKASRKPAAKARKPEKPKRTAAKNARGQLRLETNGVTAYYYEPIGPGRLTLRPVIMYLHGRGGSAASDCRRWAAVARRLGWLVCPSGPESRAHGRGWDNNWAAGRRIVMGTLNALRKKYGRRVQLYGNTLIGFSEGAYVAMNVGVREPRAFNRWLILAADSRYWGAQGLEELGKRKRRVRRVYLITGKEDSTYEGTLTVKRWLRKHRVAVRSSTPEGMGHVVALGKRAAMYRAALRWLERG